MSGQAGAGRGLQDAVSTLQDVIKSQQAKGQEHEPTPTEYFAVISAMVSVGSGGDRLMDLLKVLTAVVPSASKPVVQGQFKPLSQSLLNILKVQANDETAVQTILQALGAIMQQQEQSDGFWNAVHSLQSINALLSFVDSDSSKIRKLSTTILSTLMQAHQQKKASALRSYVADFCVGVILSCSRASYKRTHCVVLFLETVLALVPEEKVMSIMEYSLRLQLCEIPKLTAAVYRMYDTTFQSPYYSFTAATTLQALQLLLASRPATSDMESNTYFCTALASAVLCLRKQDKAALITGTPSGASATPASAANSSNLLNRCVASLIAMCESEFVQVHCAVSTALKRIVCTVFERRTNAMISAAMQNGTAALEESQLQALLQCVAGLFQLKYQNAWLYLLDTMRSLFDLFRHNGRPAKMLAKVVTSLAEVYQAIEHGVLQNTPAAVHLALSETVGSAVRSLGLKAFLEIVPLTDATGQIPTSREWLISALQSNLKHMPCYLVDFGNCLLPIANHYFKLLKASPGASSPTEEKLYRTRISQVWSLLPEMCAYNVRDLADTYSKLLPIMERLFADADFPELLTHVVRALHQLAKGVRERCPRTAAAAGKEVVTPELTAMRSSTTKLIPLVLQYVEGVAIGESRFQEGVQCIAALCEIAPAGMVAAVSKKLLQLVLTSTAANGLADPRENAAAAGWMAVMLAIIPLLPESLVQLLFKSIRPLLTASEASSVQKRAYSLLLALLNEHRKTVLALEQPLEMLRAVSEALLTCHVSSRSMRLQCIRSLMSEMSTDELEQALRTVHKEVLICQKDANKKTRDGAVDILKLAIAKLSPEVVLQTLMTALTNVADVKTNAGSVLKSSIVTALCLLMLHHRSNPAVLSAGVQLLPQVGELLVDDCPHQTKAVLSYIRVFVSIQPVETVANQDLLPGLVAAFTVSLGSHKAKFAPRCRAIMRKLTHRIGEELLRSVVPPSDQPLLDYVCKHARRYVDDLVVIIPRIRTDDRM
jgi:ribosomal RNA-processing protein 12